MVLPMRASLGGLFAASAVLATGLAWHEHRARHRQATNDEVIEWVARTSAADSAPPPSPAATNEPQQLPDSGQDPEEGEAPGPDAPSATIADVDLAWLPKGYVRDVGHDKTAELAQLVEAWASSDSEEPRIEYRKGVVFARSEEDRGDEGPTPRSAQVQDQRVCGEASVWLRDSLRRRLANETLTCDRNVCSYGGGEYAPDGYLVFHEVDMDGEPQWALDAWIELYRAGINPDIAHQNEADVVRALRHERTTSCAGEPAGAY